MAAISIRVSSSLAINVNDCVTETKSKSSTNVDAATRMQLSHYLRPLPPPTLHAHSRPHRDVVEGRGEAVRGEPWSLPDSAWVDPGGCGHGGADDLTQPRGCVKGRWGRGSSIMGGGG